MASQLEPTWAPDAVGFITAARAWRLWEMQDGAQRLASVAKSTIWQPMKKLEAKCINPPFPTFHEALGGYVLQHPTPSAKCQCGIWGLSEGQEVRKRYRNDMEIYGPWRAIFHHLAVKPTIYVYGVIAMWGRMVIGTKGWRGQFAYPQALLLDIEKGPTLEVLEQLSGAYGIPLVESWPALSEIEVNG